MENAYEIHIIKSNRKTIGLEIKEPGILIVRAPNRARKKDILQMLQSHEKWIESHMQKMAEKSREEIKKFSYTEVEAMAEEALRIIPPKVKEFAALLGVDYGRITVRNQRTRWGSCSGKGNLNFNCLLVKAPEHIMDYVIVHELCHRIEMNHSKQFWTLVSKVIPDYKACRKWLRENGDELIRRL